MSHEPTITPPERHPRARRHSTATMRTAMAMYAGGDGWTPTEIARYFAGHGTLVSVERIREWVVPGLAEHRLNRRNERARERRAERVDLLKVTHHAAGEPLGLQAWLPRAGKLAAPPQKQGRGRPTRRQAWGPELADRLLARGLELRELGVAYPAISAVFRVYENAEINADVLRAWLTENGAARDPTKARLMHERMARPTSAA